MAGWLKKPHSRLLSLTLVLAFGGWFFPEFAIAQGQVSPNPNPQGNTIRLDSGSNWFNENQFSNYGQIESFDRLVNSGMLVSYGELTNSGTLTNQTMLTNIGKLTNTGELNNQATVTNEFGGLLTNSGTWTNDGILTNNGTLNNSGHFNNYGTLNGDGIVSGLFTDEGILAPGDSLGVLTFSGNLFKAAGSLEIELGGIFNGGGDKSLTDFDWMDVEGVFNIAGTLDVTLVNGFQLDDQYAFEIVNLEGTLTGQFDGLGEGASVGNFGGVDLFITYFGGDGNDVVLFTNSSSIPEPNVFGLLMLGMGWFTARRRCMRS